MKFTQEELDARVAEAVADKLAENEDLISRLREVEAEREHERSHHASEMAAAEATWKMQRDLRDRARDEVRKLREAAREALATRPNDDFSPEREYERILRAALAAAPPEGEDNP